MSEALVEARFKGDAHTDRSKLNSARTQHKIVLVKKITQTVQFIPALLHKCVQAVI